jgi:hypothetical protein
MRLLAMAVITPPKRAVFQGWGSTTLSSKHIKRKVLMRNPIFSRENV